MLRAVNLNDEVYRWRVEIDDGPAQRFLTIQLDAMKLLAAQAMPQALLGVDEMGAKIAGEWLQVTATTRAAEVIFGCAGKSPLAPLFQRGKWPGNCVGHPSALPISIRCTSLVPS